MAEPTEKDSRGPTNLRIKFRSASLDQFIERYAVDVSRGGIFIRTREPLSVGTRLKLEFQLQDAAPLLAGEGTVVWIREADPMRENVTPGMGVRFDKLTPESQPTLDKILAEKTRLQTAGVSPTGIGKSGGGMAVRRTSGIFPAVDAAGLPKVPPPVPTPTARAAPTAPAAPPAPATTAGAAEPAPSRPPSPFASVSKTSFMASRAVTPAAPPAPAVTGGPFRARTTTGSGVRPAPVPSALFEPPTADDIDKALEALHETSGTYVPPPPETPSVAQAMPDAEAAPDAPRFVSDDASNEPTRVVDVVEELVGGGGGGGGTGSTARPPVLPDGPDVSSVGRVNVAPAEHPLGAGTAASALDGPIESDLPDVEPARPLPPEPRGHKPGPIPKQGGVAQPVAPERSTRFRAASSAYPTLQRRKLGLMGLATVVIGGIAIVGVLKLHWKERLFPRMAAPAAPVVEAPAAAVPPPANPAPPNRAPEGAGGAAAAEVAPPAPPSTPPPKDEAAPKENPAPGAAAKPPSAEAPPGAQDHAAAKHGGPRRRPREAAEGAADQKTPGPGPAAATDRPAGGAKAAGEKAAGEKAGGEKAADKPADDKSAAAAAPSPTEAAPPAPPPPVLKITSTPAGAEVIIDGSSVGSTPFISKAIDPAAPHAITVKKDGYESTERMIGGLDWSRPHGNTPQSLKVNVKLRRAAAPAATPAAPKENAEPEDTGGPYIKEIKPDAP